MLGSRRETTRRTPQGPDHKARGDQARDDKVRDDKARDEEAQDDKERHDQDRDVSKLGRLELLCGLGGVSN